MSVRYRKQNDEVYYMADARVIWDDTDIAFLKAQAAENTRRRCRLCAHPTSDATVHEMLIVHANDAYVRPHRHLGRAESFQVIEGTAIAAFFDEQGTVVDARRMTTPGNGGAFFYRIPENTFHSLIIESAWLVFHECVQGPFDPDRCEFASWAPDGEESAAAAAFTKSLETDLDGFI